jgi:hypothetical protein
MTHLRYYADHYVDRYFRFRTYRMALRWLLELKTVPASDETGFRYQLWLSELDTGRDQPSVCINTVDELFDAIIASQGSHPLDNAEADSPPGAGPVSHP